MLAVWRRPMPQRMLPYRMREALEVAAQVAPFTSPATVALRLTVAPRLNLLCHPKRPSHWQMLYKICALNGFRIVADPARRYDVAIHFADGGRCGLPDNRIVLNRHCTDISKRHVAKLFESVFGYSLEVDPRMHQGKMVEKSDANYRHDGRIVRGPLPEDVIDPACVYQRLIGNTEGGEAIDLRTPLYGGQVPFVYVKRRPLASRFANENSSVELREAREVFSCDELSKLSEFAAGMGLDYGELDVLRDSNDGRIYVVDVANTPAGPPNGLSEADAKVAVHRLASEFRALLSGLSAWFVPQHQN